MKQNATHTGDEEYCFFLAVIFPDNQLKIIDYNRVVKDLNGLASSQLIAALGEHFTVEKERQGDLHSRPVAQFRYVS